LSGGTANAIIRVRRMKKTIVIVEDDAVVGFVYQTYLKREGFEVELATDGEAGLARVLRCNPAGVLLDLMLPKMPGMEVLKKLRAEPHLARIPVMVFTNAFVPDMINDALHSGATKVFNKAETTPRQVVEALKDAGCFAREG